MGRNDEASAPPARRHEVVKALDLLDRGAEVDQQDMFSANGLLDAGDEDDPPFSCIWCEGLEIELAVVKGDRQGVVPE